ncbi:MAG TPA: HlyD family secretion protein [Armatimonadota bacterium]|jgi:membrane fusion protein (multidrug efflux system)
MTEPQVKASISEEVLKPKLGSNSKKKETARKAPSPKVMAGLAVIFVLLVVFGARYWTFASHHVYTDNAALSNDVIQISPQVSGTVLKVLVKDNEEVKAGQLLVVLDPSNYDAARAQKQADLDAAVAQAKGAGVNVALTTETGSAQMLQAEGVLGQAQSNIISAKVEVVRSEAAAENSVAMSKSAEANVKNAQAAVNAAISNKRRSADNVNSAQAMLDASKASVRAANAVYEKAAHDADRYSTLVAKGAVSKQAYDGAVSASLSAQAQLENAQAVVLQKQADLSGAREQLESSDAAIEEARSQLAAVRQQAAAALTGIRQARAQQQAARQNVVLAQARREQAAGQMNQAKTTTRQVAVSQSGEAQAMAKIEQAAAALKSANLQLGYTKIYAPVSGRVSKKSVQVGALVQIGTPLMAIIPDSNIWVVANFKETQVDRVRPGQYAEMEVDAFPGRKFTGRVDSIASATGSTFALLPPDNATGNFVKVVQRVPVKIVLDDGQADLDLLRAGMSVNAVVRVK